MYVSVSWLPFILPTESKSIWRVWNGILRSPKKLCIKKHNQQEIETLMQIQTHKHTHTHRHLFSEFGITVNKNSNRWQWNIKEFGVEILQQLNNYLNKNSTETATTTTITLCYNEYAKCEIKTNSNIHIYIATDSNSNKNKQYFKTLSLVSPAFLLHLLIERCCWFFFNWSTKLTYFR